MYYKIIINPIKSSNIGPYVGSGIKHLNKIYVTKKMFFLLSDFTYEILSNLAFV